MARNPFPMTAEAKRLLALYRQNSALNTAHWANVRANGLGDPDRELTAKEQERWNTTGVPKRAHNEICNEAAASVLFRIRSKGYRPQARDAAAVYLASQFIPRLRYDLAGLVGHLIGAETFEPSQLPKHERQCWAPYLRRAKRRARR